MNADELLMNRAQGKSGSKFKGQSKGLTRRREGVAAPGQRKSRKVAESKSRKAGKGAGGGSSFVIPLLPAIPLLASGAGIG
jgi:hypothetical protein